MVEPENKILGRDEIYRILTMALVEKLPEPPAGWCASKLTEELWKATREFEPDAFIRQQDALFKCLCYLVDFARRMPEWINLKTSNERVKKMCEELADEIEKITFSPEAVIDKHGKLKSWLYAKLEVQTCWIYREETERNIAEETQAKRLRQIEQPVKNSSIKTNPQPEKWQSALAKEIFQRVSGKKQGNSAEQPNLF